MEDGGGLPRHVGGSSNHTIHRTKGNRMFNRKFMALALGIASLSVGTAGASATIIGSPSQDNSQSSNTSQGASQTAGAPGGVVVGPIVQADTNSNSATQNDTELMGVGGGPTIGSPSQKNTQGASTSQQVNQAAGGGGVVVGPIVQAQANLNATLQNNVAILF